jgi:hypothetical protein
MKSQFLRLRFWMPVMVTCGIAVSSCKKILHVEPENVLTGEQTYRNVFDADAAIIGLYGKFMNLAKPYIILNELRADLMDVTTNADQYLRQLNNHTVTADNPYIDPRPFYEVILNCNDIMKNFDIMHQQKKLKDLEYNMRYSDVASIRSFVYLQLGIHFGSVPYVTNPIAEVHTLADESIYPRMSFQQLLAELIKTMEALPFKEIYPAGTSLVTTVDQYFTQKFFINKNVLLGELHLWNGAYDNSSYRKAATYYRKVIDTEHNATNINTLYNTYKIAFPDVTISNNISVQYIRFRESDINALIESNTEGWRSIFSRGASNYDDRFNWEWIWYLPFTKNFAPKNPLIDLFSNVGGSYQVMPSKQAIDNWNSQVQYNGFPFDARGRFTYKMINGQPVIMKFLYYSIDGSSFLPFVNANGRTGDWFLYRAATLIQHFAEAANRDRRFKLAYALINAGIGPTYDNPANSDKTNSMQTYDSPPYDFDARNGDNPQFRSEYYKNRGLRDRAFLKAAPVPAGSDSLTVIENMITDEAALELAYEGQRWPDLLRVAIRKNNASYLADKIYNKLIKSGTSSGAASQARAKLLSGDWYLPFKIW